MQPQLSKSLYTAGAVFSFSGVVCQLFDLNFAPYLFTLGAIVLIYFPIKQMLDMRNEDVVERRKARSELIAGLLLGLAAYFMFIHSNSWVVVLLIYALSTLVLSFRNKK